MITLDMTKKADRVRILDNAFTLENGVLTLQISLGSYDLTGKTVTAAFSPNLVETGSLVVTDGVIAIPISPSLVAAGNNHIQLNIRTATTLEQSPVMLWQVGRSIVSTTAPSADPDITGEILADITTLETGKEDKGNKKTTLADDSDTFYPSQKAVKTAVDLKVDKVTGKGLSANDFTNTLKSKLDGVAEGATNYSHPANHAPSIITQDASNRFVTDAEKSTWNATSEVVYATNIIKSGDFTATTDWTSQGAVNTVESNIISSTADGSKAEPWLYQGWTITTNHIYYIKAKIRVTNANCQVINFWNGGNMQEAISYPTANAWYEFSINNTFFASNFFLFEHVYSSAAVASGKVMQVQYALVLDLTAIYGAGNEPTSVQMDLLMDNFSNRWFSGTSALVNTLGLLKLAGEPTAVQSKWSGKIAAFLGDSITSGYSLTTPRDEMFTSLIQKDLGLKKVFNAGTPGTRIANKGGDNSCFAIRYATMDTSNTADIAFVMGGTNDYGHSLSLNGEANTAFGTFADTTDATFYGALHILFSGMLAKYPNKTVVVMTPPHMIALTGATGTDYTVNPETSKNLKQYCDAIREVAECYGLPVLDLFKTCSKLNPNIGAQKTASMPDGVHPNAAGHRIIADAIINFIKTL